MRLVYRYALGASLMGIAAAALWETAAFAGACNGRWPHAGDVLVALASDSGSLLRRTGATMISVGMSLGLGLVIGAPLGVYLAGTRYKLYGLYEVVAAIRPLPVTVLIPVFIAIFGLESYGVPLIALPIAANVAVNVASAIKSCGERRRRLMISWGLRPVEYLRHVLVYEVMESVAATMRIMVPFALAVHIALDYFLQSNEGLGAYVAAAYERYKFAHMFAGVAVVVGVGLVLSLGLDHLVDRCLRWKHDT